MQTKLVISLIGIKKLELFTVLLAHHGDMKDVEEIIDDVDRIFEWAFPNEHDEQKKVH